MPLLLCFDRTLPNCGCGWSKIRVWHVRARLIANKQRTAACSVLLGKSVALKLCWQRYRLQQKQKAQTADTARHLADFGGERFVVTTYPVFLFVHSLSFTCMINHKSTLTNYGLLWLENRKWY